MLNTTTSPTISENAALLLLRALSPLATIYIEVRA
jgi:hypothetical protein